MEESLTKTIPKEELFGRIIKLNKGAFWKSAGETVEVNAFTGNITATISKEITEEDYISIVKSLRIGTIVFTDKKEKAEPAAQNISDLIPTADAARAQRILDEKDIKVFNEAAIVLPLNMLESCLKLERSGRSREGYVKILSKKISEFK